MLQTHLPELCGVCATVTVHKEEMAMVWHNTACSSSSLPNNPHTSALSHPHSLSITSHLSVMPSRCCCNDSQTEGLVTASTRDAQSQSRLLCTLLWSSLCSGRQNWPQCRSPNCYCWKLGSSSCSSTDHHHHCSLETHSA